MSEGDQINLFARYEQRLLSGDTSKSQAIPAVVITGFLGSGKTTLVHHILRNRGSLRIAVLVNEVGTLDVDSQLVNAKQANAALGLAAADLAGGCVCCSRSEDLAEALRRIRDPAGAAAVASGAASHPAVSSSAPCDYLLVETSGAADAGPLAEALVAWGFRLDAVVAVVDAEAGGEALKHKVARAQVICADVVVLNKCDLVGPGSGGTGGLGALADMEDLLAEMAPGVRVVRARYGEVPLTAVLDVEPVGAADDGGGGGGGGSSAGADQAAGGGGGFMSHESVPSLRGSAAAAAGGAWRATSGPLTADGLAVGTSRRIQRRVQPPTTTSTSTADPPKATNSTTLHLHHLESSPVGQHHHHHHHHGEPGSARDADAGGGADAADPSGGHRHGGGNRDSGPETTSGTAPRPEAHSRLHSGFHTACVTAAEGPSSLAAFAAFVVRRLGREPALLRSKGVLWFRERRGVRFIFHLSGRRRVELAAEGPWDGPPSSCLVLIGSDAAAMARLRGAFLEEVAGAAAGGGPQRLTSRVPVWSLGSARAGVADPELEAATAAAVPELEAAAARISAHERLELLSCELWGPAEAAAAAAEGVRGSAEAVAAGPTACGCDVVGEGGGVDVPDGGLIGSSGGGAGGGGGALLHFTTRGSALHGINAEDLNAELMRRANAGGRLLLAAVTAPGRISAVTHIQSRDRALSLLLACKRSEAEKQAELVVAIAEPLLRKAYAHVHNCKCDVASAMQTFAR